jgi:hypothetical protein
MRCLPVNRNVPSSMFIFFSFGCKYPKNINTLSIGDENIPHHPNFICTLHPTFSPFHWKRGVCVPMHYANVQHCIEHIICFTINGIFEHTSNMVGGVIHLDHVTASLSRTFFSPVFLSCSQFPVLYSLFSILCPLLPTLRCPVQFYPSSVCPLCDSSETYRSAMRTLPTPRILPAQTSVAQ